MFPFLFSLCVNLYRNLDRLQQNLNFLTAIADNQRLVDAQVWIRDEYF